jgi:hypothetical protein
VDYDAGTGRYRLLETLRQFAIERLEDEGQVGQSRDRHADYFRALAEEAAPQLHDARYMEAKTRLDPDVDNFRAAASWLAARQRWADLLTLARDLYGYMTARAPHDAIGWYGQAIDHRELLDAQQVVDALGELAMLAVNVGDLVILEESVRGSQALAEAEGLLPSPQGCAALVSLRWLSGDHHGALDESIRARDIAQRRHDVWAEVVADANADSALAALGQPEEGRRHGEHALELARQSGNPWVHDIAVNCRACAQLLAGAQGRLEDVAAAVSLVESYLAESEVAGPSSAAWLSSVLGVGRLMVGQPDPLDRIVASFRMADKIGIPDLIELNLHELALTCCRAGWPTKAARLTGYLRTLGGSRSFAAVDDWLDAEIQALVATIPPDEWLSGQRAGATFDRHQLLSLIESVVSDDARDGDGLTAAGIPGQAAIPSGFD